jgi:hypothetical protein
MRCPYLFLSGGEMRFSDLLEGPGRTLYNSREKKENWDGR